ncbi:MAG: hypothetical protein RB191_13410 [Terriglobia bacterium]|nr:hypothetical protein [Terriglobia bacterium]
MTHRQRFFPPQGRCRSWHVALVTRQRAVAGARQANTQLTIGYPLALSTIMRESVAVMTVRVLPGHAIQVRHDAAPTVTTIYTEGEVITDLRREQADVLIANGIVEAVDE